MIVGKRQIFFLFVLIFWVNAAEAQRNKSQLQKEKQQNLEKIKETEKILAETGQQKKNSLGTLSALMQRVNQPETTEPERDELLRRQQELRSLKRQPLTPQSSVK